MKPKLITTHPQYYLLVNEEDHSFKVKEYGYDNRKKEAGRRIKQVLYKSSLPINNGIKGFAPQWDKIIAHLPKGNAPKLEGVDLLPDLSYYQMIKMIILNSWLKKHLLNMQINGSILM